MKLCGQRGRAQRLIAGAHRLEACKQLGWEYIDGYMLDVDDLAAELAEIDENLIRAELTVLERSEHLARRKVIYEQLHPETRHGAAKPGSPKDGIIPSFADDAAQKTGVSKSTVQQETKIAKDIAAPVKDSIRGTALADSKTDLLALSRLNEDEQGQARSNHYISGLFRRGQKLTPCWTAKKTCHVLGWVMLQ